MNFLELIEKENWLNKEPVMIFSDNFGKHERFVTRKYRMALKVLI